MKSILILILSLALASAAFFTRPTRADFKNYIVQQGTKGDGNVFAKGWDEYQAKNFADNCDFKDRFLWVDVQKDGQSVYTGAFSHWFDRAALKEKIENAKHK